MVAEEAVHHLHGASVEAAFSEYGLEVATLLFGGGEERKTRTQKRRLEDEMLRQGLGRDSVVIALGGGVTCDVAGFLAATYERGVPWVALPTTLLAMVDASVGGKVAVNTAHGKNLIGAFHQPSRVHCDTGFLQTLPDRELRSGLAEVAKAAFLEGEVRTARLRELARPVQDRDGSALAETIEAAVRLKARVVEQDEEDRDYRHVLNFGHTLGHAIEAAADYTLRHGEAVAIGMVLETQLAEQAGIAQKGLAREVGRLLQKLGLPTLLPGDLDPGAVHARLHADKKVREGRVRFALLERFGRPHKGPDGWSVEIGEPAVRNVIGLG
jgi:3-dehydroquinate synthase